MMQLNIVLTQYEDHVERVLGTIPFRPETFTALPGFRIAMEATQLDVSSDAEAMDYRVAVEALKPHSSINLGLRFSGTWSEAPIHVMIPAAVYNGNRFEVLKMSYPPMFRPEEYGKDRPAAITDVPHLTPTGGVLSLRAGDCAVPAVCLFDSEAKMGTILFYPSHGEDDVNMETGCILREEKRDYTVTLEHPIVRSDGMYRFGDIRSDAPCEDPAADLLPGQTLSLTARVCTFPCEDISTLYRQYFRLSRKEGQIAGKTSTPHQVPLSHAFSLIEAKYNRSNWLAPEEFYCVGENTGLYSCWQTGWVGGVNAAWPLYLSGSQETSERALSTMDFLFRHMQAPTGFFYANYRDGKVFGDDFRNIEHKGFTLMRKNADALYFASLMMVACKHQNKPIDPLWEAGLIRSADAFCNLYETEGQLGQFVDIDTLKILAGGTASSAMAVGGLVLSYRFGGDARYLETAKQIAAYYYNDYVTLGLANGGPGEILSAPDSESAYALLEGMTLLFEETGDRQYLTWAEDAAALYATWCMNYDYRFPANSQFRIHDIRTTGAVWANIQNKHGAPGVCTHSGSALFRLYLHTGDEIYFN
ncbi:MAG: hypothetical protein ACK5LX_09335 [Oscillospiraceae bacterium]